MQTREEKLAYATEYRKKNKEKLKEYARVYGKTYYQRNKSKIQTRVRVSKHGITKLDYYAALALGCEICRKGFLTPQHTSGQKHNSMSMDHDTGRFRGFLCASCNLMLGQSKDNPETLKKASRYLETHAC